jgi:cytochrome bd-type quinol oxidase subunit 1
MVVLSLSIFVSLSLFSAQALHAEESSERKYLDEESEQWRGGPALFETKEGLERTPVPPMEGWWAKKKSKLPEGVVEFPELASDPLNPNTDMISAEQWNGTYPTFSYFGLSNREIVWIIAQLHILFAAFILAVPLFGVTCEILGWRSGEEKYERLAKEVIKVVVICYSLTALTGGFLLLLLVTFYPSLMFWLFRGFKDLITFWYPMLFIIETMLMYSYYYMWEPLVRLKLRWVHITLGILLNVAGTGVLVLMNAPASFMLTPLKGGDSLKGITSLSEWAWINSGIWASFNFHRIIANIAFSGMIVGFISAFMYLMSKTEEEKKYYDWQGYLGNTIGIGFLAPLIGVGYYHAYEIYKYDATIGMYIMSDRLSMFMLVQAVLISFIFIGSNYYIWISTKRVEGALKYLRAIKVTYVLMFVCVAVWFAPRHFFATMILEPGMVPEGMTEEAYLATTEVPGHLAWIGLMKAKNTAAIVLVFLTFLNFVLYRVAVRKGKIIYGKIDPVAQYVLIFLAFSATWLMGLMGAIRELARKNYHVYRVFKDMTPDAYTPTLQHTGMIVTLITLIFFATLSFIVWMQLKFSKVEAVKDSGEGG